MQDDLDWQALQGQAPAAIDLTDEAHLNAVRDLADNLLGLATTGALARAEQQAKAGDASLGLQLALKLARSKRALAELARPVHLSVVFSAYKEHQRILHRDDHPHGENFLLRKVAQLGWLCDDIEGASWDLVMVDDGCPEGSGDIAQQQIDANDLGRSVKVLWLNNAIEQGLPVTAGLKTAADSQKGGGILYGMWHAAQTKRENHVVLFTDADLSTHLGQAGLLIAPIIGRDMLVAIGSRREELSVVVKQGVRNVRGKLFIYLWKRMLPQLGYIVDTQCGFKAFAAEHVREIVAGCDEKRFAVDIELLLRSELHRRDCIEKVPIAWIDSEAASTTTDIQPYLAMLQSVARMYRRYMVADPAAAEFAAFVDGLDDSGWDQVLERVPPSIAERDPAEFGTFDQVSVDMLMQ